MLFKKFIPFDACIDIYKIDYSKLYSEGRRIILFDLDNTIISYDYDIPGEDSKELFKRLKEIGFEIVIMSNNHSKRIKRASLELEVFGLSNAKKPLKYGYKKVIKKFNILNLKEVIAIGDQVLTDVYGANRMGIDTILCNAIRRSSEKWYTKLNRNMEKFIIERLKNRNNDIYNKIKECRKETL